MDYEQLIKNVKLMESLQNANLIEVSKLLHEGADVNFVNLNGQKETPLHLAVLSGDPNIVETLLASGANSELQNVNNKKPKDLCSFFDAQKKQAIEAVFEKFCKVHEPTVSNQQVQPKSDPTVPTYIKRPGTAAVGQFYETKMLTMVLFRLLHDERIESFFLGNNLDEAGAFDDIVLKTTAVGGQSRVYSVQAKHKKPEHVVNYEDLVNVKDKKGDFNLGKYFESFLEIRYMFDPDSEHVIFQGDFEQTKLEQIIYTPAVINYASEMSRQGTNRDNLFYTNKTGKIIEIRYSKALEETFVAKSEEWHKKTIAEILAKLISYEKYDTLNVKDAIKKIESENVLEKITKKKCEFNGLNVLKLYGNPILMAIPNRNLKKMCQEIEGKLEKSFLPNVHVKLVEKFFAQLRFYSEQATEDKLEAVVRSDMRARSIASDEIFFSKLHDAVESWWKQSGEVPFQTKNCEIYEITANQVELEIIHENSLSKVKIDEVKFDVGELVKSEWVKLVRHFEQFFVNIFSTTPELCCVRVIQYLKSQGNDIKFVIIDVAKHRHRLESLLMAVPNSLVIVYLPEVEHEIVESIRRSANRSIFITKQQYDGDWMSISDETRGLLDLETNSLENVLETQVAFQKCSIQLGKLLGKAPLDFIDAETLHKIMYNDTFNISNNSFSMDFEELKGCYINRDILDIRCEKLVPIGKIPTKVVIVAAEPGMGKSTFLTGHAIELKKSDPLKWVVKMNLLDLSKQFSEWSEAKTVLTEDHAKNLLMDITSYDSRQIGSFERKIFEWHCKQRMIVLLIDAFDEISPNYTGTVLQLIQIYRHNFTAKLRITTRFGGVVKELEKSRNFVQYSLNPFTMEESKLFLGNFWKTKLGAKFDQQKFETYFLQLLSHLQEKSDVGKDDLVSIPLQVKMIAIIFQTHFGDYCDSTDGRQARFEKLDLITLYAAFIELQFKVILLEEKNKTDTSKPYHADQMKKCIKEIQNTHQLAAIFALFEYIKSHDIFDDAEMESLGNFLENVKTSHEKTGIITKIVFGKPMFVHRTYAEFFAAQFIWEKYTLIQTEGLDKFYTLIRYIINNDFIQIAKFVQLLAQKNIHFCFDVTNKACNLLDKLMGILDDSLKKISSRAFAFILGIVEHSVARDDSCFQEVKEFVCKKTDYFRDILLIKASESGYLELIRLLTEDNRDKINASFVEIEGRTASQIETEYTHDYMYIIHRTANENILNSFRFSPLHWAARKGSTKVVSFLLDQGAPIDTITKLGETPLYLACAEGHLEVVQMLISRGANTNIATDQISTPLHIACKNGHSNVVQTLLDVNANDLDICTALGEVPLHTAITQSFTEIALLLLEKGANVNIAAKESGWTPLHLAIQQNLLKIVEMLLQRGANIHSVTPDREDTVLHLAVAADNLEMVRLLISKGALVNALNKCGKTALSYAVKNKSNNIVILLLDNGADLYEWDSGWTPLHEAASVGSLELVKLFLEKGIDVNRPARYGVTPLMLACFARQTNMVKLMLDKGANVQLGTHRDAYMPMHCAAEKDCPEMIRLFAKKGANINCVTTGMGYTPLQAAVDCKSIKAVNLLLRMGADPDLGSMYGYTTVEMARVRLRFDINPFG